MCGIFGTTDTVQKKLFRQGLELLHHRGPDETTISETDAVLLGMQRLAIQDLHPQLYPFAFSKKKLIFNGEIYNFHEIRKKIEQAGLHAFKTTCDAEVILPFVDAYGWKALAEIQGMFAIAIYDQENNKIHLARDPFGEKPLYYALTDSKQLWFSSELKAFPKQVREVSPESLTTYLSFGFIPDEKTVFKNIYKVLPGQVVTFDIQRRKIEKKMFFNLMNKPKIWQSTSQNSLKETLLEIVKNKLISDVPVGCFLSGGLDSSLLTAIAQQHTSQPLHTFSISFDGYREDESVYASQVGKYLKTRHHKLTYSSKDMVTQWDEVIYSLDEPLSDPAVFPTYFLAQQAKKEVSVVITGEGGDEIFGGYERYLKELAGMRIRKFVPQVLKNSSLIQSKYLFWKIFSEVSKHYLPVNYVWEWYSSPQSRATYKKRIEALWQHHFSRGAANASDSSSLQLFDLANYVSEQLCMKIDKMCMAHSVESRAPFLDKKLLPWLYASAQELSSQNRSKPLLKEIAIDFLPPAIIERKKQGFSLPLSQWLTHDLSDLVNGLKSPHPLLLELYDKQTFSLLLGKLNSGKRVESTVWNLLIVNSWLESNG
ncbi:asparagine synthase (glutamine-hydrolyzing) [Candidatus Woesebacteria bacterium]|nr:asparagine synthase (glutamine-hydrolyzing) [Candidatus Woesebacteria bacterium]